MSEPLPPLPLRPESSDATAPSPSAAQGGQTAGGLLRQARQARGLHIAALAAAIKVTPQKLEALENDRLDQLPGATFARALAQTVCRFLKIDATPVLALLPQAADEGLMRISQGLNAPFRDRPGRRPTRDLSVLKNPGVIGAAVLMLAAIVVYLVPGDWVPRAGSSEEPAVVVQPVDEPVPSAAPGVEVASAPLAAEAASAPASDAASASAPLAALPVAPIAPIASALPAEASPVSAAASAAISPAPDVASPAVLQIRAQGDSWVEVTDRRGRSLLSRVVRTGESLSIDGNPPLRVTVGNAAVTSVVYKGQSVDLAASTRDNVARVELK
jgi:cytoskeleton protein RodZ